MNNSYKKFEYGDIAIRTENSFYFGGDLAKG